MKLQPRLNANHLKLIAIIVMTIDHVCDLIYPGFPAKPQAIGLHIVGRLTAPIMWFFVCEGYYYTHNVKKYMLRMGVFALISHYAYCFAFGISVVPFSTGIFNQASVMYPLFVAILVMWMKDSDLVCCHIFGGIFPVREQRLCPCTDRCSVGVPSSDAV